MPKLAARFLAPCLLVAAPLFAACSDGAAPDPELTHSPTAAGAEHADPTASPGDGSHASPLLAIDATTARLKLGRALLGRVAGCGETYRVYEYDRATHALTSPACVNADGGGVAGNPSFAEYPALERVLTDAEAGTVEARLAELTYTLPTACGGWDGEEYFMTTRTDAGVEINYSAENINCYNYRVAPALRGIVVMFETLAKTP